MEPRQTLTLSSVGQITIPRSIRKLLGLEKGSKLDYEVDEKKKTLTLKRQPTVDEVFAELEAFHKTLPKPDPRAKSMTAGEISLEQAKDIEGDTWV